MRMRAESVTFLVASAVTVAGAVTGRESWQRAAKPLIAPTLAVRAWRERAADPVDATLAVAGLAAATVGDCYLIEPDDDRRLVRGAGWFALMQAAYTARWLRRGARPTALAVAPRVAGWTAAGTALRLKSPQVATPLSAYGLTLGTATALSSDPALRDPALFAGAQLFTVSDALIVVRRLFVRGDRNRRIAEGAILATYAAAQWLLTGPRRTAE